eukprot:scaffold58829_cov30-Tisochrysis_lutea.AAC.2
MVILSHNFNVRPRARPAMRARPRKPPAALRMLQHVAPPTATPHLDSQIAALDLGAGCAHWHTIAGEPNRHAPAPHGLSRSHNHKPPATDGAHANFPLECVVPCWQPDDTAEVGAATYTTEAA